MTKGSATSNEEIIAALLSNGTMKAAAAAVGMSTRALYDRINTNNREFKAMYAAAKADLIRQAVNTLNGKLQEAITTVAEIMTDSNNNAAVRLQAAQTILNNAGKYAQVLAAQEQIVENARHDPADDLIFPFSF